MWALDTPIPERAVALLNRGSSRAHLDIDALVELGALERLPDLIDHEEPALRVNRVLGTVLHQRAMHRLRDLPIALDWGKSDIDWFLFLEELTTLWSNPSRGEPLGRLRAHHCLVRWAFDLDRSLAPRSVTTGWALERRSSVRKRVVAHVEDALLYHCHRSPHGAREFASRLDDAVEQAGLRPATHSYAELQAWIAESTPPTREPSNETSTETTRLEALAREVLDSRGQHPAFREPARRRELTGSLAQIESLRLEIMVRYLGRD